MSNPFFYKRILTLTSLFLTINVFSQSKSNSFFKELKLEAGIGVGPFYSEKNNNVYRLQFANRDLIFDRIGFYYTLEHSNNFPSSGGYFTDLAGLNLRLSNNFSVQGAVGFLDSKSIFKTESFRKEISIAYHNVDNPYTFTFGYSFYHGPTFNFNRKIFGYNKHKKDIKNRQLLHTKGIDSENLQPFANTKESSFISNDMNLEIGLGISPFYSNDNENVFRLQFVSRDLILNRIGLHYTIERSKHFPKSDGWFTDVFGASIKLNDNFSLQAGVGFADSKSIFKTESFRKELSFAYHPSKIPFTFTTGYSAYHGPSLTINFKIYNRKNNRINEGGIQAKNQNNIEFKIDNKNEDEKKTKIQNNIATKTDTVDNSTITNESSIDSINEEIVSKNESKNKTSTIIKDEGVLINNLPKKFEIDKLCEENRINNNYNSSELNEFDKLKLMNFVKFLQKYSDYKLKIIGRTDKIGSENFNLRLGQKRADNAKNFIVEKGIKSSRILSISIGEKQSQDANTDLERSEARKTLFELFK